MGGTTFLSENALRVEKSYFPLEALVHLGMGFISNISSHWKRGSLGIAFRPLKIPTTAGEKVVWSHLGSASLGWVSD